jgi:molybdopterin synthase catalytic subunit
MINISIQQHDFNQTALYQSLLGFAHTGAVVTFTGLVREFDDANPKQPLFLEHYPGMTENTLHKIAAQACAKWPLNAVSLVHRIGHLAPTEQIVFVGVASAHRKAAFEACQFMMDFLKTQAPFWKKEGTHWVKAKASDQEAADAWQYLG